MTAARLQASLAGLAGPARGLVAAAAGALAALAFAPVHALPVLVLSFPVLLWLLDGCARARRPRLAAFLLGWWFGLGHFIAGIYWIANALLVDAERFGWLVPFAVVGLAAYFALFPAAAVLAASFARPGARRVLALAGAWGLAEYARGHLLTGFPWNPMGSALAGFDAPVQAAALVGAFGLSLFVVAVAAAPAASAGAQAGAGIRRFYPVALAALLFAALWGAGAFRLAMAPPVGTVPADAPRLRIVQGAVAQSLKWQPDLARRHFELYLDLTRRPPATAGAPPPAAVIWPETAVSYVFDGGEEYTKALARAAPPGGVLVTGVVRRGAAPADGGRPPIWNALIAVDGRGRLLAHYDKHHLVPFGEYVPLARFNPLPKLTEGRVDFAAGPGPAVLDLPGLPPFAPLICYEAIFPAAVTPPGGPRPAFLLNLTNDAWFGVSTGPHQHLAQARLRAVEEGLPLVRAANTGISTVTDAYGREIAALGLGARGVFDVALPPALPPTLFAQAGNWPFLGLAVLLLAAALGRGNAPPRRPVNGRSADHDPAPDRGPDRG